MKVPPQNELPLRKNNLARLSAILTCLAVASQLLLIFVLMNVGVGTAAIVLLALAPIVFALFGFISGGLTLLFETGRRGRYLFYALSALVVCGGILLLRFPAIG